MSVNIIKSYFCRSMLRSF